MTNIVKHDKKKKNNLLTIFITIIIIIIIFIGLDKLINKGQKNNKEMVTKVLDNSYTKGDINAKVKLIEYADFQCPACRSLSPVLDSVFEEVNNKYGSTTLSITFKHFPLTSIHKNALLSAYSAEAARLQGRFWDFEKVLFEKQNEWGEALDAKSKIESYAKDMNLDMAKFITDRDSDSSRSIVNSALLEATKLKLNHTPTVFMNGEEMIDLQHNKDYIIKEIEKELLK